jgi:hypothetical protein
MPYFGIPIRNGLPIGLGSVAGFGVSEQFSPASLFSSGEQGAWYDPSDLSTLFTDSAGTTPVTAVEQSVGLMLDKSKGGRQSLPITGWVKDSGDGVVTVNGGTITITGATTTTRVDILAPGWAIGNLGDITINGTVSGAVGPFLFIGGSPFAIVAGTNTYQSLISSSTLCRVQITSGSATFDITSRGVVQGNHAFQSTSTSRPMLRARYNLLTYSEQFDNAAWTRGSLTVDPNTTATTDPLGGNTADKLQENAANAEHYILQSLTASATQYTATVYLKAAERTWASVYLTTSALASTWFNLAADGTGGVGTVAPGVTATAQYIGNGWYRCSITRTLTAASWSLVINPALGDGVSVVYAGTLNSGIYAWGAQLIVTNSLTSNAYQRIAAATDYDTSGFLPYLFFDGTDDSLLTNSVDFTATDKMTVWAGARKLSDVGTGSIAQLSASTSTNNGVFGLYAPFNTGASADYAWQSKGTTRITVNSSVSTGPATSVFTGIGDISAPLAQLRQNAVQVATSSASQGTGNFGNFAIQVGTGAGVLNGNLYSLIIRGAQSSAAQISSTESWVNGKTGAY